MHIHCKAYTPAIPPRWTDFPYADTYVHAEVAPTAAVLASSFQDLPSMLQLPEPHLVLLLEFPLELLFEVQAAHHLVHRTVAEQGTVPEGWPVVPSRLHFHLLLQLMSLLLITWSPHRNQAVTYKWIITFSTKYKMYYTILV
jgi:hypothetical protein